MTPEEKTKVLNKKDNFKENSIPAKSAKKVKAILRCNSVTKKFASKAVLKGCSLSLNKGELMAVIAPEGHGKSTLAKVSAGLIHPTEGNISIRGVKAGRITNSIVSYQPDIPFFKYDTTVSELCIAGFLRILVIKKLMSFLNILKFQGVHVLKIFQLLPFLLFK